MSIISINSHFTTEKRKLPIEWNLDFSNPHFFQISPPYPNFRTNFRFPWRFEKSGFQLCLSLLHIQFLLIFVSFKEAIQDSDNDNDDDFLKVREKTSEEKVIEILIFSSLMLL